MSDGWRPVDLTVIGNDDRAAKNIEIQVSRDKNDFLDSYTAAFLRKSRIPTEGVTDLSVTKFGSLNEVHIRLERVQQIKDASDSIVETYLMRTNSNQSALLTSIERRRTYYDFS